MINATDIKRGMIIKFNDAPCLVLSYEHITPGNKRAMIQAKLRNLKQGNTVEHRFRSGDRLEQVYVDAQPMEYLYQDGEQFIFMNPSTYDQMPLSREVVSEVLPYLKSNIEVTVNYYDNEPISIDLPHTVDLKITQTDPGLKGATVTNVHKPATLETGVVVNVPPFIEQGETIRVDTRTGKYVERVK